MKPPIVTISDDLDIFESKERAEGYFEGWILDYPFLAYDSEGRVLRASIVKSDERRFFGLFKSSFESISLSDTDEFNLEALNQNLREYLIRLNRNVPDDSPQFTIEAIKEIGFT